MDNRKWQSLNQLLEDLSGLSSESEDLIRLVSQLVLELASELPYINTMSSPDQDLETYSLNQNEELV